MGFYEMIALALIASFGGIGLIGTAVGGIIWAVKKGGKR